MNTNSAHWRGRSRRRGIVQLVDQALEVAFSDDDPNFAEQIEETPRLARGICWSDVVAEMERDRRRAEAGEAA